MSGSPDSVRIVTPLRQRSLQSVLAKSRSLAELSAELPDHSAPKAVAKVQERPKSSRGRNPKDKDAVREELREYIVSNGGVDDGKWEVEVRSCVPRAVWFCGPLLYQCHTSTRNTFVEMK